MPSVDGCEAAIDLQGVPASQHAFAKREIRTLLDGVAAAAQGSGTPFPVNRICVTDRYEDEVRRLLEERSGDAGYEAMRAHVRALGKTLWLRSEYGEVEFVIVIDAVQAGPWEPNNPRWMATVLHELFHVLLDGHYIANRGAEEYTAVADTRERLLHRWAKGLLDEFAADRLVDHLVRSRLTNSAGKPWSLRELEEARGVDWVGALLDGLGQMPDALDDKISQFRNWRMGIDELCVAVIPEINDILNLLVHTASLYIDTERWPDILSAIEDTTTSRRFLRHHLKSILDQLENPDLPFDESVKTVECAVEGIFLNCGLGFRTVAGGLYISVDAPSP